MRRGNCAKKCHARPRQPKTPDLGGKPFGRRAFLPLRGRPGFWAAFPGDSRGVLRASGRASGSRTDAGVEAIPGIWIQLAAAAARGRMGLVSRTRSRRHWRHSSD